MLIIALLCSMDISIQKPYLCGRWTCLCVYSFGAQACLCLYACFAIFIICIFWCWVSSVSTYALVDCLYILVHVLYVLLCQQLPCYESLSLLCPCPWFLAALVGTWYQTVGWWQEQLVNKSRSLLFSCEFSGLQVSVICDAIFFFWERVWMMMMMMNNCNMMVIFSYILIIIRWYLILNLWCMF